MSSHLGKTALLRRKFPLKKCSPTASKIFLLLYFSIVSTQNVIPDQGVNFITVKMITLFGTFKVLFEIGKPELNILDAVAEQNCSLNRESLMLYYNNTNRIVRIAKNR